DVHRAALALAVAVDAAEELRHHALDVGALGDAVAVSAMRAGHAVGGREVCANADGDRFLSDVWMNGAVDLSCCPQLERELVELPDQNHLAQHLDEIGRFRTHLPSPSARCP